MMYKIYKSQMETFRRNYMEMSPILDELLASHLEEVREEEDESSARQYFRGYSRCSAWKELPSPYGTLMICEAYLLVEEDDAGDWEILDWSVGE